MKRHIFGALAAVQAGLVTTVLAHPGPPGHVHPDEWPFGPLAVAVGVLLVVGAGWVKRKSRLGK